jgi:hypothetical protein
LKNAETGRSGPTPQQILRSLVLMRIKKWDYRELHERIADGCTLRQFTDFYCLRCLDMMHSEAPGCRRIKGFRDRTRSARRRMQEIQRMTRQRQQRQTGTYRELIGIAEEVVERARTALRQTRKAHGKDLIADLAIAETRKEIERFCSLGSRVIDQSRRRVLDGEQVPAAEKLYSIFEPHTDLIKRGRVQTPIEFGHKVFLAERACGLVTQYYVLDGNPAERTARGCLAGNDTAQRKCWCFATEAS